MFVVCCVLRVVVGVVVDLSGDGDCLNCHTKRYEDGAGKNYDDGDDEAQSEL